MNGGVNFFDNWIAMAIAKAHYLVVQFKKKGIAEVICYVNDYIKLYVMGVIGHDENNCL